MPGCVLCLLCSVVTLFLSVEAAISAFSKSRPPGIYKQHYLEELVSRYNGNMAEVSIPELPEWCLLEGQEVGEREGEEEAGGRDTGSRKRRRELQKENATFAVCMSEVSVVQGPVREEVQRRCQGILNWEGSGFPGSQPVSMDKKNLQLIRAKPYRVSWKADGTRYIMYIRGKGEVFLLDRDNSVFSCPVLTFPSRAETGHLADTVLDGELVEDKLPNGVRPRYLVYDIMQLSGRPDIVRCDHATRQRCIQEEIIAPRDIAVQHGSIDKQAEPFSVRLKQFWDVRDTRWVLDRFVPKLTHGNDGLVFNPLQDPYTPGQSPSVLKWKPPSLNTVDFKLAVVEIDRPGMLKEKVGQLWVGGYQVPFSQIDLKRNKEARNYNGRIVECSWSPHGWTFLRLREDKSFPNSYTTAASVCSSIKEPVTRDILLRVVENERWVPRLPPTTTPSDTQQLMPPPKKIPRTEPQPS
jgi:mRNA-capping enzyme